MTLMTRGQSLPRSALWLVAGLLLISAVFFVTGVAIERSGENQAISALQSNVSVPKSADSDTDGGEGHVDAPTTTQTTPAQTEAVLGIDLENPWLVGAVAVSSLLLIAALLRFGYRVLPIIVLFAVATGLFDTSEVLRQTQRNNLPVLLFAGVVLAAHVAVAVVALLNLYKHRTALSNAEPSMPSMTS